MNTIISFSNEDIKAAQLAEAIALAYGVRPSEAKNIKKAVVLHDIGKFKIPRHIIDKPGRLTPSEFKVIKTHTFLGANTLSNLRADFKVMAKNICLLHHERYDKKGYWGLGTDELPYYIAIAGISDVYTALTTQRPYKEAWGKNEAIKYIRSQAGKQFCPIMVKVFLSLMEGEQFGKS